MYLLFFQMRSVQYIPYLLLALCVASSWSWVPDSSIPLGSGSPTVKIPVDCNTALPSGILLCFDFVEENWGCSWIVNQRPFNSPLVISKTDTSIVVDVTNVCSVPIQVDCAINQNNDVIYIEIKECMYFLLYTYKFRVLYVSFSYSCVI